MEGKSIRAVFTKTNKTNNFKKTLHIPSYSLTTLGKCTSGKFAVWLRDEGNHRQGPLSEQNLVVNFRAIKHPQGICFHSERFYPLHHA